MITAHRPRSADPRPRAPSRSSADRPARAPSSARAAWRRRPAGSRAGAASPRPARRAPCCTTLMPSRPPRTDTLTRALQLWLSRSTFSVSCTARRRRAPLRCWTAPSAPAAAGATPAGAAAAGLGRRRGRLCPQAFAALDRPSLRLVLPLAGAAGGAASPGWPSPPRSTSSGGAVGAAGVLCCGILYFGHKKD